MSWKVLRDNLSFVNACTKSAYSCITAASAALIKTTVPLSWVLHNYKELYACQESQWDYL